MPLRKRLTPSGVWKYQERRGQCCSGKWQKSWRNIRRNWQPSRRSTMVGIEFMLIVSSESDHHAIGKTFDWALIADVTGSIRAFQYYAGWADKLSGQTFEVCSYLSHGRRCLLSNLGRLTRHSWRTQDMNPLVSWGRLSLVCLQSWDVVVDLLLMYLFRELSSHVTAILIVYVIFRCLFF